ncbi:M48 family metallopeptidase [Hydrogenimonas cancrithermarum]|uniref:YgjP-like metallopeptidase domain-containing protein n=1 Tax=Hydrogenimonas cancrithermarum TaxID=2993563 RepID=A0ABN6WSH7_9BACT|nr:SprT family zinc-dependent metalloprotease [Hydrogenimonas cancrithermarum]BDY11907.1 hypothetical protein HCR_02190 [Hydrogenimonas cancrithermarum]
MGSVIYGDHTIAYKIERKPTLKHTYIQVDGKGVLVKTHTATPEREIEAMVLKKSRWILKHLKAYRRDPEEKEIRTGSRLYYLGKSYYVRVVKEERREVEVRFIYSKFIVKTPFDAVPSTIENAIEAFYRTKAKEKIVPLVRKWQKKMGVVPAHVSFRKAQKRWGSCSNTDRLSFNYHVIKLPVNLIEYVVVHELAHIRYKNHSREFWSFVEKCMPDYRKRIERIKIFEKM